MKCFAYLSSESQSSYLPEIYTMNLVIPLITFKNQRNPCVVTVLLKIASTYKQKFLCGQFLKRQVIISLVL